MEPDALAYTANRTSQAAISTAISTKRIADTLDKIADAIVRGPGEGLPSFLDQLQGVLADESHNHAQRMRS